MVRKSAAYCYHEEGVGTGTDDAEDGAIGCACLVIRIGWGGLTKWKPGLPTPGVAATLKRGYNTKRVNTSPKSCCYIVVDIF